MSSWNGVTTIILSREQHCDFVRELYSQGYTAHHKSQLCRHYRIGKDPKQVWAFAEPYSGRFGKGIKLCIPQRGTQWDVVVYYIKSKSNQLDCKPKGVKK